MNIIISFYVNAYSVIEVKLFDFVEKTLALCKNLLTNPYEVYFLFARQANISFA